ncbi:MFS transporter [Tateyamaria omphalii]|uniref:MFS transporter n=1 Tax=Tateyamaria omphalii TaxID=299262 RepID=A0A1P8MT32_9RHOB|nr:MFS transporter [Tateyamaria omphalii]APX11172.1 MFS transporter [Tateyamaria omphalii]
MTDQRAPQTPAAPVFYAGFCAERSRPFILVAAILASSLGFIDGTVVAIALPAMRDSLGADLIQAQWIHNAYMLTLSALILVGGAMGDRFGLGRVFGLGIALFVVASIFCALAPTPLFMIIARAVQGIGAAVMVPGSLALIARAYPRESRGRAIGIWAAASALTTAAGPIIGGLALTVGGPEMWRWIFAINLPLGGLALYLLWRHLAEDPSRDDARVDIPGALTATFALLAIAWGLTSLDQGGGATLWLTGGAVMLLIFLWTQSRSTHPMMPLTLFASRPFSAANALSFALYSALSIMFFFMPMTFIAGWGLSEIEASAAFAPMSVFISLLSARAGRLADRIGPAPLLMGGSLVVAMGYATMALLAPYQNFWAHMLPAMCLVGLGMAAVVAPLSTAIMAAVDEDQSGIASGINNAVTRMAGLISVAAVGGIVAALYTGAGGTASFGVQSDTATHGAAMTAAFSGLAWIATALALISAGLGWLTRDVTRS